MVEEKSFIVDKRENVAEASGVQTDPSHERRGSGREEVKREGSK